MHSSSPNNAASCPPSLPHQEIMNQVFGIPLIVKRICFYIFLESRKDLLILRLLNRLFQEEATKELLSSPTMYSIKLWKESQMKKFLDLMKRRQDVLRLRPFFPFSSFSLQSSSLDSKCIYGFDCYWDSELTETFCKMSGGQIRSLDFIANARTIENVVKILSHSPRLIQIKCKYEWRTLCPLTPKQIAVLPSTFHELRYLKLTLGYWEEEMELRDELCPLFEVLIRRAPGLERVRVPVVPGFGDQVPEMRILRLLLETHSRNLPLISCNYIRICPNMPTEWMEWNFPFCNINIRMHNSGATALEVDSMNRRVEAWIGLQSATLTSFGLESKNLLRPLTLPALRSLQKLDIDYHVVDPTEDPHCPIEALDPSRYPSLHNLCISRPPDDAGRISMRPMGLVQVLGLSRASRFTNPNWKQTFPNLRALTSLNFGFNGSSLHGTYHRNKDAKSSIFFILTHLPTLVHLSIHHGLRDLCLWNLLTGHAPRLTPDSPELHTNSVLTPPPEPLTGIYRIPSLENMRALKTLELGEITTRGTLDAFLYMTCAGLLGPLHKLTLEIDQGLLLVPESEREDCRRRLARVHEKVKLHFY